MGKDGKKGKGLRVGKKSKCYGWEKGARVKVGEKREGLRVGGRVNDGKGLR